MTNLSDSVKENVAIVLVPGSFSPEHLYNKVSRQLITEGFTAVRECPLLSAAPKNDQRQPPAKLEDDAMYIREVLAAYLTQGRDVVLVMNSYAGFPGTEAIKSLASRSSLAGETVEGQRKGAVVGMIYLSSFLPFPGDSLRNSMSDYLVEPLKSGDPGNYMSLTDEYAPAIFSDLMAEGKDEEVKFWFEKIYTHSSDSFDGKVTYDMWADGAYAGKSVYILGENDLVVPPALAETMVEKVSAKAGKDKVKLVKIEKGGHAMHVTKPEVVVRAITDLLAELQK